MRAPLRVGGSAIEVHIYGPPELLEKPEAVLLARAAMRQKEIAIRAALTGHLVFSTLHTNDAPSAKAVCAVTASW